MTRLGNEECPLSPRVGEALVTVVDAVVLSISAIGSADDAGWCSRADSLQLAPTDHTVVLAEDSVIRRALVMVAGPHHLRTEVISPSRKY